MVMVIKIILQFCYNILSTPTPTTITVPPPSPLHHPSLTTPISITFSHLGIDRVRRPSLVCPPARSPTAYPAFSHFSLPVRPLVPRQPALRPPGRLPARQSIRLSLR